MSLLQTNKKSTIITVVFLVIIITLIGGITYYIHQRSLADALNEANGTLFNTGNAAAYVDMNNNPLTLDAYKGSILIVNNWASWSPYATEELPLLEKIAADYESRHVIVLALNRKENKDQAQRLLNTLPPLPHVKVVIDTTDFFYGATGGYAMPETLIYDQAGTIIGHIRGTLNDATLRAQLDTLVSKQ